MTPAVLPHENGSTVQPVCETVSDSGPMGRVSLWQASRPKMTMVRWRLRKQASGLWGVKQLFPHLQSMIFKQKVTFDVVDADASDAGDDLPVCDDVLDLVE